MFKERIETFPVSVLAFSWILFVFYLLNTYGDNLYYCGLVTGCNDLYLFVPVTVNLTSCQGHKRIRWNKVAGFSPCSECESTECISLHLLIYCCLYYVSCVVSF